VVVVGSSNTDLVVRTGERLPAPGETVLGGDLLITAGGKGANQAVAAARLGAEVTLIACLGRDGYGDRAAAGLADEGINTEWLVRDPQAPSGTALIMVSDSGENLIAVSPGANARLTPDHIARAHPALRSADVLLLQLETPLETVEAAARFAADTTASVVLDPAPAQPLGDELLSFVDILTPNLSEAELLAGERIDSEEAARRVAAGLANRGARQVVLTRGPGGCLAHTPEGNFTVPAAATVAVDATAAGDCFNGALACAIGRGTDLRQALEFASRAAAIAVSRVGAQSSLPRHAEL
jgi:ribokinase